MEVMETQKGFCTVEDAAHKPDEHNLLAAGYGSKMPLINDKVLF